MLWFATMHGSAYLRNRLGQCVASSEGAMSSVAMVCDRALSRWKAELELRAMVWDGALDFKGTPSIVSSMQWFETVHGA